MIDKNCYNPNVFILIFGRNMSKCKKDEKNYLYYLISMSEMISKLLLLGEKFLPEMHLKQLRFTYSGSRPFTKNKGRMQRFNRKQEI